MEKFQQLVSKVLSDDDFAQALLDKPEKTLQEEGIEPTTEMLDALKGIEIEAVRNLAVAFGNKSCVS